MIGVAIRRASAKPLGVDLEVYNGNSQPRAPKYMKGDILVGGSDEVDYQTSMIIGMPG